MPAPKYVSKSVTGRNPDVALVADQNAAARKEASTAALSSTAGQGSAGIEDGAKAKSQVENGPSGLN